MGGEKRPIRRCFLARPRVTSGHVSTCCKCVRRSEGCWWIWGRTQRAPLWLTGYHRCFIVHDCKQNCPFCGFFMATRKNAFIFQGYLVWHHTRQCQEVPCSVMIVLAVFVEKKALPLQKRPPTTLWVGDQHSGGRPISWRYSRGNTVEVGQIKINHDDRTKKNEVERILLKGWQAG